MKINQLYIVLVTCVLALAGCRKITPPVIDAPELPDFRVDLNVDGESKSLVAGDRNYYMNTSWERDSDGVHTFIGNLAQYDCLNQCAEQLTIKIRDYQQAETPFVDITGALPFNENFVYEADSVIIGTPDTMVWSISADNNFIPGTADYVWLINGLVQNTVDNTLSYTSTFEDRILVDLMVTSDTLVNSIFTSRFFGASNAPQGLGIEVGVTPAAQNTFELEALASGGVAPYTFAWSNGASTAIISSSPINSEYQVTVTDGNGDTTKTAVVFEGINTQNPTIYYSNINASVGTQSGTPPSDSNPLSLGIVTIEYTDANGLFYSTALGAQPANASFVIADAQEYDPNIDEEAVKQLLLDFECAVFTETGQQLSLSSIDALFGIAYPD